MCVASGFIYSGISRGDARYAKEAQVKEAFHVHLAANAYLENRVDVIELQDRERAVQQKIWDLEKTFAGTKMPPAVIKQKQELEEDHKNLKEAIRVREAERSYNRQQYQQQQTAPSPVPVPLPSSGSTGYENRPAQSYDSIKSQNPYLQRK
jgi:hypothetical protein